MLCGFVVTMVDLRVDEVKVEDCVTNFVVEVGVGNVVVLGKVLEIVVEVLGLTMDVVVVVI